MAKVRTQYTCSDCGASTSQWVGKCPGCQAWNTLAAETVADSGKRTHRYAEGVTGGVLRQRVMPLAEVSTDKVTRLSSGEVELDRVLGGGVVPGSLILLGGEPGIGKSTLMLQVAMMVSSFGKKVLYVSGEESPEQVRMRAMRIGKVPSDLMVLPETRVPLVLSALKEDDFSLLFIDSVQTLDQPEIDGAPGSVSQIRESVAAITAHAKAHALPVFLVGHITKEGSIAGPKVLEHMVDVVLQFEGDRNHAYRMLRAAKNRFGTTSELGIYEMLGDGLKAVENPSEVLLGEAGEASSGSAISVALEGVRPLLIEMQALVSTAVYGTPQRSGTGFDLRRLNMLLAVLEKRCGFKLGSFDVFLNLAGGLKIKDPANDLAVVAAILSSSLDLPLDRDTCYAGEVGLSGEIRPVARLEERMSEAARLGMKRMLVSGHGKPPQVPKGLKIVAIKRVSDIQRVIF
ncbi:MAG: DNA repair protein RadA [Flavobacteriales bacterium]|nr:DNA repair protein RadA [Flavobacteriales bacterium]MBT6174275.1 DNA repair protein RadA [Flavobacteriales bacterium]